MTPIYLSKALQYALRQRDIAIEAANDKGCTIRKRDCDMKVNMVLYFGTDRENEIPEGSRMMIYDEEVQLINNTWQSLPSKESQL